MRDDYDVLASDAMNTTTEIVVLLFFLGLAGVGIAGIPRQDRSRGDWMTAIGLLGAIGWLCWVFMRPGGESVAQFWGMIRDFVQGNY